MVITFDKLIKNFDRFDKKGAILIQKEIFKLFEPIVYQAILTTRIDSGTGRASLGLPFTREIIPSQRIINAIEYDVEVNAKAYHFWANSFGIKDPRTDFMGMVKPLISGKKINLEIISYDQGVINQNNGEFPSSIVDGNGKRIHPRIKPERHVPYHLRDIPRVIDGNVNLETFDGGGIWLTSVAQDIRYNLKLLYKRVEELLFT